MSAESIRRSLQKRDGCLKLREMPRTPSGCTQIVSAYIMDEAHMLHACPWRKFRSQSKDRDLYIIRACSGSPGVCIAHATTTAHFLGYSNGLSSRSFVFIWTLRGGYNNFFPACQAELIGVRSMLLWKWALQGPVRLYSRFENLLGFQRPRTNRLSACTGKKAVEGLTNGDQKYTSWCDSNQSMQCALTRRLPPSIRNLCDVRTLIRASVGILHQFACNALVARDHRVTAYKAVMPSSAGINITGFPAASSTIYSSGVNSLRV
nr:hypothetical protein CFP56_11075 [Quercus suber]